MRKAPGSVYDKWNISVVIFLNIAIFFNTNYNLWMEILSMLCSVYDRNASDIYLSFPGKYKLT